MAAVTSALDKMATTPHKGNATVQYCTETRPEPKHGQSSTRTLASAQSRDEIRGAYRAQSIRAIEEVHGDVDAFLRELDTKRRQLDDQIHRYIKQRERDFKLFERDMRVKYRTAAANADPTRETSSETAQVQRRTSDSYPQSSPSSRAELRRDESGVKDRHSTREREVDLLGLFTPSYLPLLHRPVGELETKGTASTSAPASPAPIQKLQQPTAAMPRPPHRANSDPVDEKDSPRMARTRLQQRTSSSGSDSRSLVSALKSNVAVPRMPKTKRVSLVVGDEVVAPSDNIASTSPREDVVEEQSNAGRPHSVHEGVSAPVQHDAKIPEPIRVESAPRSIEQDHSTEEPVIGAKLVADTAQDPINMTQSVHPPNASSPPLSSVSPHDDWAVLDLTESEPAALDEDDVFHGFDLDSAIKHSHDDDFVEGPLKAERISPSSSRDLLEDVLAADDDEDEYQSEDDNAIYSSSIAIPTSSLSSMRRKKPNRRSSRDLGSEMVNVQSSASSDRAIEGEEMLDFTSPEIEQNAIFGSYSASYSFLPGSLGESYMERNSQQLRAARERNERRRRSSMASS